MPRKIAARRSPIHGTGVFALVDLPKGTRVIEYKGRLLTHRQADRLYADDGETGHTFLFTLNDRYIVDGNVDGNVARWINHGCDPSCETVIEEDEGGDRRRDRIFVETVRDVAAGEELTYDYHITLEVPHTARLKKIWTCRCGAANCTGTMLAPKRGRRKA
ncbi:SET domain-containing protein [Coralloluteibacterium stylophorae]|uniref:SET domain-containing protein-lysine N-methyltransferase n=1 Tax=Coralloluteibacterium stylophorae TaxID=1776034 RepID=A0A8J7VRW5_9GAMM|nr:SET domain-containing protein-lysine N-methyltransferase [Coralloluteibacterium stylophorae]MBS7456707.1 SET domain-containing protein-lysine N-methyltransferase [Coralloluteibacterium stylophorae]